MCCHRRLYTGIANVFDPVSLVDSQAAMPPAKERLKRASLTNQIDVARRSGKLLTAVSSLGNRFGTRN
jgi:hypothetical protein